MTAATPPTPGARPNRFSIFLRIGYGVVIVADVLRLECVPRDFNPRDKNYVQLTPTGPLP